ncbi:Mss4-like protein [Dendryphion nanum]|uniref:Mss4-like protein n=1 Tax=Dendryphion nanum TaxID=256645 RepID=A0A9P9IHU8_9PLEO|nr:Mss4-like protein [Dendryphion nanum]
MSLPSANSFTGDPNAHDVSKFKDGMTGTCLCGNITVTINDPDLFTKPRGHLCHCANCRKVAGSYVSSSLLIDRSAVDIQDPNGALKTFNDWNTGSGKKVARSFCGTCGSPIMSEPDALPNRRVVKLGMFPRIPQPEMENFAAHKQPWQGNHDGLVQFATVLGGKKLGE